MGFGTLLCGYFVLFMMSFGMAEYSFAALLIGGAISYAAADNLKDYCTVFSYLRIASVLQILLGIWGSVVFVDNTFLLGLPIINDTVASVVNYISFVFEIIFHLCMLYGIFKLSGELSVEKIRSRSLTMIIMSFLLAIFQMLIITIPFLGNAQNDMPTKMLILLTLGQYVVNLFLLYSCYMTICPKGEEMGKARKPSRFAFVNNMRKKMDEKEERAVRESMEYAEERMKKKSEKKKNKKH